MGKFSLLNKFNVFVLINIVVFAYYSLDIYANKNNITFNDFNIEQGISQTTIEAIFQDSKGYVWLGTNDGLNKFNGYDFKVYNYEEDENSISNNFITDIDEDKYGNIWIATVDGVNKLNPKTGEFTNYLKENKLISGGNATEILMTKDNKILVTTDDGLNIYDPKEDKFNRVLSGNNNLSSQFMYCLDEDDKGNIWIGTKLGVSKISKDFKVINNFSIDKYNIGKGEIYNILCDDETGYTWVGSANSGLAKINMKTNEISSYKCDPFDENSIPSYSVEAIKKDSKGNLWIGTSKGLALYNKKEDNFEIYTHKIYDKNSLVNNNVKSLMEDSNGLIWVGTYSGLSVFNTESKINHYKAGQDKDYLLSENIVHGLYEDEDGKLWIGTNSKGVNIVDRKNNKSTYLNTKTEKRFKNDSINDITGKGKVIYIATDGGLLEINKDNNTINHYGVENGLVNNRIKDLLLDSKGHLWMGTIDGVSILDTKTKKIIDINKYINDGQDKNKYVRYIFEDSEGNYYLGFLRNEGLCKIDPKNKTIKHYKSSKKDKYSLSSNYVRYINEDSHGNIWVGTSYGLNKLDKETGKFERYTTKEGIANNTIYGVLADDEDDIWVSTNKGISKIDSLNKKVQNFSVTDGLQGNEFNGNAAYKSKNGELFFGGVNGLNSFYPEKIIKDNKTPKVLFDTFTVNNKEYNNIDGMKFSESTDTITIKFFTPDYSNYKNTTYEYNLDGSSGDTVRTKNNYVTYNDLPPGKYRFRVKAIDTSGNVSDENYVKFTIKPPIWLSGYAVVLYVLIGITLIGNHKYKVKKLDKLVQKKTLRLREEMEKNNVLLNRNIKLEKNKNSYFVNLSHELRTPLNVISSTNQLILELMKKDGAIKEQSLSHYIDVSQRNCKRLLNLINNIVDSTKLQNDMYIVTLEETDIVYLVEETALTLKDYVSTKGIELIIDPEIEEKIIKCDKYEIERCVVNLVGNAAKFTPEGGNITITIKDLDEKVMISVLDTGVGIEEKYHKAIFDRFSQVVDDSNKIKCGSGLGLTITSHIVKLHNGEIYVESKLGEGSNFIIILPVNPDTQGFKNKTVPNIN
ncbi:two-component regulator propeller domain-containing protein [Paraclostridium ghonii]|uniref:ligand-binding sensor domain-containing protein n=1 Tax=Paraclostridium ghonii TaxID=29358 RepID=UPI0027D7AEA7|nr:sensor histidine kinase [Paeniclostridium ghonii]